MVEMHVEDSIEIQGGQAILDGVISILESRVLDQ